METVDRFAHVRDELMACVAGFPPDKAEEEICGEWDVKSVLAHITGWDIHFTVMVRTLKSGQDVPYRGDDIQRWNEALVREGEGKTWVDIQAEFVDAGAAFLEEFGNLAGELWNQHFWEGRNPTPTWVVKHNAAHYAEHLAEIAQRLREWE